MAKKIIEMIGSSAPSSLPVPRAFRLRRLVKMPAYQSLNKYNQFIVDVIKEGQEKGYLKPDIDPRIFRNMLLGGVSHMFFRWLKVAGVREIDKLYEIEEVTNLLTSSVAK